MSGRTKKAKGKEAPAPKVPADPRAMLSLFFQRHSAKADELFQRVAEDSPAQALKLLLDMAEYVTPKLARMEVTLDKLSDEEFLAEMHRRLRSEVEPSPVQ